MSTNRRLLVAVGLLSVLAVGAGCSTIFGPESIDDEALAGEENRTYDYRWNTSHDGHLTVDSDSYAVVYAIGNRTTGERQGNFTIELYTKDALGTEEPMRLEALQFRYENGTTLQYQRRAGSVELVRQYSNGTVETTDRRGLLGVETTRKRTIVNLPTNESGQLAFTAPKSGKRVTTPTFVEGSYEMVLPRNARVGVPILAQVKPGQESIQEVDGRVHIAWTGVNRAPSIVVRYYLQRDLYIFGAILGGLLVLGTVGAAFYWLQIRETVRRREEVGLDVETGDDDDTGGDSGPPPGFR